MENEVSVISSTGAESPEVSLQVYQQVYNDLTGKSEHLRRLWVDAHLIRVADFEQMHHRLAQCAEQYDILASHCQVSVRYSTQESERYSSFEKFTRTGLGRVSATEEVEFVYDFLLKLPKVDQANPYRIELGFRSEVGVIDGFNRHNVSDAEVRLFHAITSGKARMDINYIDIAVARSFEATISSWYQGLTKNNEKPFQGFSKYLGPFVAVIVRVAAILTAAFFLSKFFSSHIFTIDDLYRLGLLSVAVLYLVNILSIRIANLMEDMIRRWRPLSLIVLSQADEQLLGYQGRNFWKSIASSIGGIIGSVAVSLLATYLAQKIGL